MEEWNAVAATGMVVAPVALPWSDSGGASEAGLSFVLAFSWLSGHVCFSFYLILALPPGDLFQLYWPTLDITMDWMRNFSTCSVK